ncbi:GIY-YIG nuclease family protein [Gordonia sp. (in: high G+C Gram-positive bacteria)]|uniref:GIY-YIG nuclease family protein n=1 Tax=Gordonia sp. (in: high G+C Gram-positive bacteria) TaxID=84139 RepID=UPI0026194190|nr:GIY-YIG nuclease family protein [Gordonia sp. (in: high G+C Gram-positive bacteria)]
MGAYLYILRCSDDSLYVGSTRDLGPRIAQHQSGLGAVYTSKRLPVELVFSQEFPDIQDAWAMERRLHGWSRAKRQAVIDGRFDLLPGLSARRGKRRSQTD